MNTAYGWGPQIRSGYQHIPEPSRCAWFWKALISAGISTSGHRSLSWKCLPRLAEVQSKVSTRRTSQMRPEIRQREFHITPDIKLFELRSVLQKGYSGTRACVPKLEMECKLIRVWGLWQKWHNRRAAASKLVSAGANKRVGSAQRNQVKFQIYRPFDEEWKN